MNKIKRTTKAIVMGSITIVGVAGVVVTTLAKKDKIKLSKPMQYGIMIKHI